jgi:hypothetical protein
MTEGDIHEPPLSVFTDDFDLGDLAVWVFNTDPALVPNEDGQAIQLSGGEDPLIFVLKFQNVVASERFQVGSDAMQIQLRRGPETSYRASVNSSGVVELYKGIDIVATATLAPLSPGEWITLRLSAIDDIVRVP